MLVGIAAKIDYNAFLFWKLETILSNSVLTPGMATGRLPASQYVENFADLHPPLTPHEALIESDRCYFCHDAPCTDACPTEIDIPMFIRQIASNVPEAAAKTIFDSNILGGMCARVCPTETLCEEACVREMSEGQAVEIGLLQRFATDRLMQIESHPYIRQADTGKTIAVIGSGPAGLACAHRLALKGNSVRIFECQPKAGGLNEYGIAAYKTVEKFAAKEVEWILGIGGIELVSDSSFIDNHRLDKLRQQYDAVFLAVGLGGVNSLSIADDNSQHITDAVEFIAQLRQTSDLSTIPVGRNVVVIGGGMTAIDAAVQSRLLGAESVTIAYRRSMNEMGASEYEQRLAASKGVKFITNVQPVNIISEGASQKIELEYTQPKNGKLTGTGEITRISADSILSAIGQMLYTVPNSLDIKEGKIIVDKKGRTNLDGVWAGGDCALGGQDLTVEAVAQGRDAAEDIHSFLNDTKTTTLSNH